MKTIFLLLLMLGTATGVSAQMKSPVVKDTVQTPALKCEECAGIIERFMIRQNGILSIRADYVKKRVIVKFLRDRQDIDDIRVALANLGFDADEVKAEPGAANRLPECCRVVTGNKQ